MAAENAVAEAAITPWRDRLTARGIEAMMKSMEAVPMLDRCRGGRLGRGTVGIAVSSLAVALLARASATVHLVRPDGTGNYPTIQAAIGAAAPGDTIALADGRFAGDGNRDLDFSGKELVVHSVSGNPGACVLDCGGSESDPHHAFRFDSGDTPTSTLEGISIVNGWAYSGGAIRCDGAAPTIRNCVFQSNSADDQGGAIWIRQASPSIEDCVFRDDSSVTYGGAICLEYSNAVIMRCEFAENSSWRGGGVECRAPPGSGYSCQLITCSFRGNQATLGGALEVEGTDVRATRCDFSDNTAELRGGAIGLYSSLTSCHVTACSLTGNQSQFGGAISASHGEAYLDSCTVAANGATLHGGAIWLWYSSLWVSSSTISENVAPLGAGISISYLYHDSVVLGNSMLVLGQGGEALYWDGTGSGGSIELTCCDVYGNEGGDWVGHIADQYGIRGNISLPPLFCGDANPAEPYTLRSDSPCAPGFNPDCGLIGAWPVGCDPASSVASPAEVPAACSLHAGAPNPFCASTTIRFEVNVAATMSLAVCDVSGRVVRMLDAETMTRPGEYRVAWDGTDARGRIQGAGVYYVRLRVGQFTVTRPVSLIR